MANHPHDNLLPWIWRHIALRLPPDWELLQFAKPPEQGRCAFADRHGFRFELSWRAAQAPPALDRLMSDYAAALTARTGSAPRPRHLASWSGLDSVVDGLRTTRFGTYLAPEGCLVEAVFLWPHAYDAALEAAILASIGAAPPVPGSGQRPWRAFGMRMLVPAGHALTQADVLPAQAELRFAPARGGDHVAFSRRGFVGEWLRLPPPQWLAQQLQAHMAAAASPTVATLHDHAIAGWHGLARARGWRRQRPPLRAEAWICPRDGRLYHWLATGAAAAPAARLLGCCDALTPSGAGTP